MIFSLGVFAMVFGIFFGSEAYADGYFGPSHWQTEDGKYELTVVTSDIEDDVELEIYRVFRVNKNNLIATPQTDYSPLFVRLCNASTGNCTSYKQFNTVGKAFFDNMKPGVFYVDIIDSYSGYFFAGTIYGRTY